MTRVALVISYVGSGYHGWQIQNGEQKHFSTVQSVIEKGIEKALGEKVNLVASGRTDQGVSSIGQVAHMDTSTSIAPEKIKYVINEHLPEDIRILRSYEVSDEFHARYSAKLKTYQYHLYVSDTTIPYFETYATRVHYDLDLEKMREGGKCLLGEHDFTSFCSANTEVESKIRTITDITITKTGQEYTFSITGNGFLYNMVRIIVGTLIDVGRGKVTVSELNHILEAKDRTQASKTMPAKGLVLYNVQYDQY